MYSIQILASKSSVRGRGDRVAAAFLALSFLIAEALIDKIQSDLPSHHLSVRKESPVSHIL